MKLREARICLDCDEIFRPETVELLDQKVRMDHCPSCGSNSHYLLCRWIPTLESVEHAIKAVNRKACPSSVTDNGSRTRITDFIPWNPERIQT